MYNIAQDIYMSRPTIMTTEVINKLEQAFALGCTDLEATLYANIAPATLYKYQEKNPAFVERKTQLKETPILMARTTVINSLSSNPDLALKFLERRKKDEFSLRKENEISVVEVTPILGGASVKSLE